MGGVTDPAGGRGRDEQADDGVAPLGGNAGYEEPGYGDSAYEDSGYREAPYDDTGYGHAGYADPAGGPLEAFLPEAPVDALRETVVAREEERFGGIKIGSAFFGWLTATAMAILLVAAVTAAGRAGFPAGMDLIAEAGQSSGGIAGVIVLVSVPFLAYFSGGYVAGRMARFNGVGQGLMVWLWAVIVAAGLTLVAIVGGGQLNVLATLNDLLRIPVGEGQLSTGGIIAVIAVAAAALVGAVLGGIAGVHYHRKVDRAGFTPTQGYYQP